MRRKGYISDKIETERNFSDAFDGFAKHKRSRGSVRSFEADREERLIRLLNAYKEETWRTSDYDDHIIHERKTRRISKLPIDDHVMQWAACLHVEPLLCGTFIRRSCSCVKGRGTHDFIRQLRNDMNDVAGTYYFVQLDVHHFFPSIAHFLMKERIRTKIKDPKLLRFLDEFIDSYKQGLPLGVKISQILANFFLARFDRDAIALFHIADDPDAMAYWTDRYVTDSFMTCRTEEQADELSKGVRYMRDKFERFVKEGLRHYSRFADNIVIQHADKTFLHIVTEMCVMVLARDYLLSVNKDWNVRPVHAGGIDVCGYVSYHDHIRLRKRNKQSLCRQVAKLRRKGLSPEEVRRVCASRIGFATHADSRNLLSKLHVNMEKRLGNVIRNRRLSIPFKGMRFDQKRPLSAIVCRQGDDESRYKIMLIDFSVEDSKMEKEEVIVQAHDEHGETRTERQTVPKKCLIIRYKRIVRTIKTTGIDGNDTELYEYEKERDGDGNLTSRDAEYYSYTGSSVMIEQAISEFSHDDLPCPTIIKEMTNKLNKHFYKFT